MHKRNIGPFEVSPVGLGCMNYSMGYGPADDKQSMKLLNQALYLGYSFLDTASLYGSGHSESLIGKAIAHRRNEYILASKCGLVKNDQGQSVPDGRPGVLKKQCEESLSRLKTDVIDLYYLHRIDSKVAVEDSVGALAELVSEGKIRCIGLSEVSSATLKQAHQVHPVTAVQSEYSLWSRTPEFGMLETCESLGVSFVPFSPLARGFLAGTARDVSQLDSDDLRSTIARLRFEVENFANNSKLLKPYAQIAQSAGCNMAQLALAWLLAQSNSQSKQTLVPIPGTRDIKHLAENIAASEITLDKETVDQLNKLINEDVVSGQRYTEALMQSSDSENDRR